MSPSKRLSAEDQELDTFIRLQAEQARQWQRTITDNEDLEKWVADGHLDFIKRKVFMDIEREAFNTITNPAFDPANVSQMAQFKALCQATRLIEAKILSRVQMAKDSRAKLNDLEKSLPEKDES